MIPAPVMFLLGLFVVSVATTTAISRTGAPKVPTMVPLLACTGFIDHADNSLNVTCDSKVPYEFIITGVPGRNGQGTIPAFVAILPADDTDAYTRKALGLSKEPQT